MIIIISNPEKITADSARVTIILIITLEIVSSISFKLVVKK